MAPSTSFDSRISSWTAVLLVAVDVEYGGGGGLLLFDPAEDDVLLGVRSGAAGAWKLGGESGDGTSAGGVDWGGGGGGSSGGQDFPDRQLPVTLYICLCTYVYQSCMDILLYIRLTCQKKKLTTNSWVINMMPKSKRTKY